MKGFRSLVFDAKRMRTTKKFKSAEEIVSKWKIVKQSNQGFRKRLIIDYSH